MVKSPVGTEIISFPMYALEAGTHPFAGKIISLSGYGLPSSGGYAAGTEVIFFPVDLRDARGSVSVGVKIVSVALDRLPGVFDKSPVFGTPFIAFIIFLPARSVAAGDPASLFIIIIAVFQPSGEHGAVGAEMVPIFSDLPISGDHMAIGCEIIFFAFMSDPAYLHDPILIGIVPVAADLEPASLHLACGSEIVPFAFMFDPAVCHRGSGTGGKIISGAAGSLEASAHYFFPVFHVEICLHAGGVTRYDLL